MPIYDFKCEACQRRVTLHYPTFDAYEAADRHHCPLCGSERLSRRIGRVALSQIDENDPRSLGRFMKNMSRELGEDIDDDFNEVVDRLESGQAPEQIEKELPDLGRSTTTDAE